jgi:glutathione synthase
MSPRALRLLVVMDPPEVLSPTADTTVVIIEEALRRGHAVWVCLPQSLSLTSQTDRGRVFATAAPVVATSRTTRPALTVGAPLRRGLDEHDVVLMRKDPPFDMDYFFATQLLERERGRTLVVNDPRGLREANEKLYIFNFTHLIAPTEVTRSMDELRAFLIREGGEMVVKPLDAAGGHGIFHVRVEDRNTNAILETSTDFGRRLVMAQRYLPEARAGDKRIILLDGEPIGAVLRVPREDETRGNLHVGGAAVKTTLDARDREICDAIGPRLRADGLAFVGIDVIGGFLTEVNVTSPTGVQEINRLDGVKLEALVVDWLERRVALQ